jgi:type II secretory pathway component GspD/PulD (secretin)
MRKKMKTIPIKITAILTVIFLLAAPGYVKKIQADNNQADLLDNKISLSVDNSPIKDVIRLLAKQNGLNISITGQELGEVSFVLNDVPLREALNAILEPNNLSWYIRNNVIVIKDAETLSLAEIQTDIINLKYISANEAKLAVTNILSEGGKAEIMTESEEAKGFKGILSTIVISDRAKVVEKAAAIINELDKPRPQLNIEVKLVETTLSNKKNLGIDWPDSYSGNFGGLVDEETGLTSLAQHSLEGGEWVWGKFTANEVSVALNMLIQNGNSRILSNPNLTSISNRPAEIGVTTTIPIQTVNRFTEGAVIQDIVTFQDLEIGITLNVTGRINEEGVVTLKVNPIIEEIIGYTGPADNQRPITSNRSMTTEVRVNNDETLVMGGLLKESTFETTKKLPLLGSIPLLGKVFQHKSTQVEKTDLTIFITPHIIAEIE